VGVPPPSPLPPPAFPPFCPGCVGIPAAAFGIKPIKYELDTLPSRMFEGAVAGDALTISTRACD